MDQLVPINFGRMQTILLADLDYFRALSPHVKETVHGPLIYIDNGANVLGVAHLDSVQSTKHFYYLVVKGAEYVMNAQLDDRIGAYVLLDLLPSMGLKFDVLLTYGEETGNSTAQFFETTKKYNWMFQFDRHGDDVVHYQYGSKHLKKKLRRSGFTDLYHGAFSDICYLDELGCEGFNVGCGYQDEHTEWAMLNVLELREQTVKFIEFWQANRNRAFPYKKKEGGAIVPSKYWRPHGWEGAGWEEWEGDYSTGGIHALRGTPMGGILAPLLRNGKKVTSPKDVPPPPEELKCAMCRSIMPSMAEPEGLCEACATNSSFCIACGRLKYLADLDEYHMCNDCLARVISNGDLITSVRCKHCDSRKLFSEIVAGYHICTPKSLRSHISSITGVG